MASGPDIARETLRGWITGALDNLARKAQVEPLTRQYRQAAAVLSDFDPLELQPAPGPDAETPAAPGEAARRLMADSVVVGTQPGVIRWSLRGDVRRHALASFGTTEELRATLQANPHRPDSDAQRMLEACIEGDVPPLDKLTAGALEGLLQAVQWLRDLPSDVPLPPAEKVAGELARKRLRAVFEHVADRNFRGREEELAELGEFAGAATNDEPKERLRRWEKLPRRAPKVVVGTGGVGKSALIAKFVLDAAYRSDPALRVPFGYLDFDDARLAIRRPETLLLQLAQQLAAQFDEGRAELPGLEARLHERLAASVTEERPLAASSLESGVAHQRRGRVEEWWEVQEGHLQAFAKFLRACIGDRPRPYLLVFDTFEEVQYRNPEQVDVVWQWLARFRERVPALRSIVSGRAEVDIRFAGSKGEKPITLEEFDMDARIGYLQARGVADDKLARVIAEQVGGNPLSLSLAAAILTKPEARKKVGSKGFKDLGRRRFWEFWKAKENVINGVLYDRLLEHLHDDDGRLQKIAHPGLALRRVDPDLIREVLAEPCELELRDPADAERLFEALKRELTLVRIEPDGSVRHKPEVRRLMLKMLESATPERIDKIHRNAVRYYADRDGVVAAAEWIYHSLQLGHEGSRVDGRWRPDWDDELQALLEGAVEELGPKASRVYLAGKLGRRDVVSRLRGDADRELAEREANERALSLLFLGNADEAMQVVNGEWRMDSAYTPLHLTRALAAVAKRDVAGHELVAEAKEAVDGALQASLEAPTDRLQMARLLIVDAHLALLAEQPENADDALSNVAELARLLRDQRMELGALVERLRMKELDDPERPALAAEAVELLERMSSSALAGNPALARAAAAELGEAAPHVVARVALVAGLGELEEDRTEAIAAALDEATEGRPSLARTRAMMATGPDPGGWGPVLREAGRTRFDEWIGRALRETAPGDAAGRAVADALRAADDWSLYVQMYDDVTRPAFEATYGEG